MARRVRQDAPSMDRAARERLRALLAAVPDNAAEDHPAFVELIEESRAAGVPWDALPVVPAYRTRGGTRLVSSVAAVVSAIGRHVG